MSLCLYHCLSYPRFKAYLFCTVMYCHLSPVWLYRIFPHYLAAARFQKKRLLNTKCFDFFVHWLKHFSFYEKFNEMFPSTFIDFYITCPLVLWAE